MNITIIALKTIVPSAFAREFTGGGWQQHYPIAGNDSKTGNEANAENELVEIPTGEKSCEDCGQITTDTCMAQQRKFKVTFKFKVGLNSKYYGVS
jgi:hypothetical protein